MQDHGVAVALDLVGHGLEYFGEEEVPRAADDDADIVRLAAHKVARAVVRYIAHVLDRGQHSAAHGVAHVGVVIEDARHGAHAHAAGLRNILDRHFATVLLNIPKFGVKRFRNRYRKRFQSL